MKSGALGVAAAAETGATSQSGREELLPGRSVTPRLEEELRESAEQGLEPSGTRVLGNWTESPFSSVVTNRDQRLARAFCGTKLRAARDPCVCCCGASEGEVACGCCRCLEEFALSWS